MTPVHWERGTSLEHEKKTDDVTWFYVIILISSRVYSLLKKRFLDVVLTGESESLYNIEGDNNWKLLIKMKPFCSIIIALINLLITSITLFQVTV